MRSVEDRSVTDPPLLSADIGASPRRCKINSPRRRLRRDDGSRTLVKRSKRVDPRAGAAGGGRLDQARSYRPDIDGLRCVAIVTVVLAHAGVPGFAGGYVGVDVFFVISGFLITRILWRELPAIRRFSLAGFYERRARRILPALMSR